MPIGYTTAVPNFLNVSILSLAVLTAAATHLPAAGPAADAKPFEEWMGQTLEQIDRDYLSEKSGLYTATAKNRNAAFAWDEGVQLSALAGAARVDKKYLKPMAGLIKALDSHWHADDKGLYGYDASPNNGGLDRYYDDNAWFALALVEAYEVSHDRDYLKRAGEVIDFILTGEDDTLGGGLWWHEQDKKSKHTCSTGPTITAMLRLERYTHDPKLKAAALRLYTWTNANLQDPGDGLYFDNIQLGGNVEKMKWSYNTALFIRANLELARTARGRQKGEYLKQALRLGKASEEKWVDAQSGAIKDGGRFAHLLTDAFCELYDATRDDHWWQLAERAAVYAHDNTRDADGLYLEHWYAKMNRDADNDPPRSLIAQSSAARAFARLSWPRPRPLRGTTVGR